MKPALMLDSRMTVDAALTRLARHGFWRHPEDRGASDLLQRLASQTRRSITEIARLRAKPLNAMLAVIRDQDGTEVRWYVQRLGDVIEFCLSQDCNTPLRIMIESRSLINATLVHSGSGQCGPVTVNLEGCEAVEADIDPRSSFVELARIELSEGDLETRGADVETEVSAGRLLPTSVKARMLEAWPRLAAPMLVVAGHPFTLSVGFADDKQADVAGAPVVIPLPPEGLPIDMTVELSTSKGISTLSGWSCPLVFQPERLNDAHVTFQLVGEPVKEAEPLLTMLEVRFVIDGTAVGTAARPIAIIAPPTTAIPRLVDNEGMLPRETPVSFEADDVPPDLTIEISKPDRNAANGQFVCTLRSPNALRTERGPFYLDLHEDAKTFARNLVDDVRMMSGDPLINATLKGYGTLIADCLPSEVFEAIREVAEYCAPEPPAVLIVSAEPYVPWELAWMDPPIDGTQPGWLGCQTLLGRWLRSTQPEGTQTGARKPSVHPLSRMQVRNLAVMAAWYRPESGLRQLENAEAEARALVTSHAAHELSATSDAIQKLLSNAGNVESIQAMHIAGHGEFDPTRPDASIFLLENGMPLPSILFRSAQFGGALQPLLFLNACMLGIGGELLGTAAGFPGNALRGGFGGVLGALWEVDDQVAHDIALEFWRRALPTSMIPGEPVGAILRSLRAKYQNAAEKLPTSTFLAYAYYGHPRLTLTRVP